MGGPWAKEPIWEKPPSGEKGEGRIFKKGERGSFEKLRPSKKGRLQKKGKLENKLYGGEGV